MALARAVHTPLLSGDPQSRDSLVSYSARRPPCDGRDLGNRHCGHLTMTHDAGVPGAACTKRSNPGAQDRISDVFTSPSQFFKAVQTREHHSVDITYQSELAV